MKEFLVKNSAFIAIIVLLLMLNMNQCTTTRNLDKRVDSLTVKVEKFPETLQNRGILLTNKSVDSIVSRQLYRFLIYETDLDNKRTSLSQIESKLYISDSK